MRRADEPQVIHLKGDAVVVPIDEYRRLHALDRLASEEDQEVALAESTMEAHRSGQIPDYASHHDYAGMAEYAARSGVLDVANVADDLARGAPQQRGGERLVSGTAAHTRALWTAQA